MHRQLSMLSPQTMTDAYNDADALIAEFPHLPDALDMSPDASAEAIAEWMLGVREFDETNTASLKAALDWAGWDYPLAGSRHFDPEDC